MSMDRRKPLISFIIVSYKQESYIREAVEGAFSQTYSPLEIILSDDNSPDGTFAIMKQMADSYRGPHKIILNKNSENLGIGAHINRVMELCSGELIVGSAGDDISLPHRTERIWDEFLSSGKRAMSISSNGLVIDEQGIGYTYITKTSNPSGEIVERDRSEEISFLNINPLREEDYFPENIIDSQYILHGSTHAWSREIFDVFGPMLTPVKYEDRVLPFRSALLGEIRYIDEVLVKYRQHRENTSRLEMSAEMTRRNTFENEAVYRNWLRDLGTFETIQADKKDRITLMRRSLESKLAGVRRDMMLYDSSWFRRGMAIFNELLSGMTWKTARKRIGVFLLPGIYDMYIIVRYGKKYARRSRGDL
ncbi:MAG: glycosyltransferase [Spirochaetes bacterium]|nr:glycosyltransferase [Spirochaetota bacterium]